MVTTGKRSAECPLDRERSRKSARVEKSHHTVVKARRRTDDQNASLHQQSETQTHIGAVDGFAEKTEPVDYWCRHCQWPRYWLQGSDNMENIFAQKRSMSRSATENSQSEPATAESTMNETMPREQKSAEYSQPECMVLLETKGIFMQESPHGITESSKALCTELLTEPRDPPRGTLFDDDRFERTCTLNETRNEAMVIEDISRLIIPSAESTDIHNIPSVSIEGLAESVNEGWNYAIPITKTRPQPDYAVGFRRQAFTQDQLYKMRLMIGDFSTRMQSYFLATNYMYFPFLTCEVECGADALDIADRQNAHSTAISVRATVELFRAVKREVELHREILAFSVSYNHQAATIHAYYPEISGAETKIYRYPLREFSFTDSEGKEKWATHQFTRNVYESWAPIHLKRICSAIDQIPADISFSVSSVSGQTDATRDQSGSSIAQSERSFDSAH